MGGGYEGKKFLCTYNGPLIFDSLFKMSFFSRGNFFFGFRWMGGLAGGWVRQIPPPPPPWTCTSLFQCTGGWQFFFLLVLRTALSCGTPGTRHGQRIVAPPEASVPSFGCQPCALCCPGLLRALCLWEACDAFWAPFPLRVTDMKLASSRAICILSHWPYFALYKAFLWDLHYKCITESPVPLEAYVEREDGGCIGWRGVAPPGTHEAHVMG